MVKKSLPIEYNRQRPIGFVSLDPYNFLFMDRLFDDVKIVTPTKQEWLSKLPLLAKTSSLNLSANSLADSPRKYATTQKFVSQYKEDSSRKYIMYAPIDPPYKINPLAFLMNSPTVAHAYENKRYFRDEFADLIKVPDYEIRYMTQLDKAASFKGLWDRFDGPFMLQDEESSGSKGTYSIKDYEDYVDALASLKKFSQGRTIVVSKYIHGEPCSIQVCITHYGIFSGGIQRQLIGSKYLCNPKLNGATGWCGGEIGVTYPDIVQHRAQEVASVIGSELASHGYKGVFGVDLIVTPENDVYAIEINARLTGYSHIISEMQMLNGKIPFMLLHALELGNYKYEVTDAEALPSTATYKKPGSLLILNNMQSETIVLRHDILPGLYKLVGDRVEFVKPAYTLDAVRADDMMLIMSRFMAGDNIEPGKRILKIMKLGKTMYRGDLNQKAQALVTAVRTTFGLE